MKILISSAYYSPHISGLTNSIKNLAELLARNNYEVQVLTTQHKKSLALHEKLHGAQLNRVPYLFKISKGFVLPSFLFRAYKEVKNADQILINLPQVEGVLIAMLGKMMGKKVHSIYVCEVTLQGGWFAKNIEQVLRLANKTCLSLSDSIITLTEDFAISSGVLADAKKKVQVIPPVIQVPVINEALKRNLTKKIARKDSLLLGFLGRIASEKGIEYLLDAVPKLQKAFPQDITIILAGPEQVVGETDYQKKIAERLDEYKENIVRIGELRDEELGAFYSLLDVLVLPSINSTEVFGMVQVEAMVCGTPVVATNLPGVRTVIQQTGMGEIAKKKNTDDLASKLIQVLKYKNSYTKRKTEVKELFSPKIVLQSYNELFNN